MEQIPISFYKWIEWQPYQLKIRTILIQPRKNGTIYGKKIFADSV